MLQQYRSFRISGYRVCTFHFPARGGCATERLIDGDRIKKEKNN